MSEREDFYQNNLFNYEFDPAGAHQPTPSQKELYKLAKKNNKITIDGNIPEFIYIPPVSSYIIENTCKNREE